MSKNVSDLISEDTKIDKDGAVTGTLKYVSGWTDFSSNEDEQDGNFFPVVLGDKHRDKEITCTGKTTKKATDLEWVLRVADTSSTFTFSTDEDGTILTLSFKDATLQPNSVRARATRTVAKKSTALKNNDS